MHVYLIYQIRNVVQTTEDFTMNNRSEFVEENIKKLGYNTKSFAKEIGLAIQLYVLCWKETSKVQK